MNIVKTNILILEDRSILLNISLAIICVFLALFYVITANRITAKQYNLSLINRDIARLMEENGSLESSKLSVEDLTGLEAFAVEHSLVMAKTPHHIFENGSVAFKQ